MPNDKTYEAIPLFGEDGKIQYNSEVKPICLQDYVTKGWQEINLESEIKSILDKSRV